MSAVTVFPPWSYSSRKMFEQCPEKWKHRYVLKDYTEPPQLHLEHGKTIHKLLEDRINLSQPLPAHMAKLEPLMSVLVRFEADETLVEHEVGLDAKLRPVAFYSKAVWCRGIIDLGLIRSELGIVCDYKSGKRYPDFDQTEMSAHVLFIQKPKLQKVKQVFIWTRYGDGGEKSPEKLYDSKNTHRDESPAFWAKTFPRIERMKYAFDNNDYFEKPSGLCGFCWVKTCKHCPNK